MEFVPSDDAFKNAINPPKIEGKPASVCYIIQKTMSADVKNPRAAQLNLFKIGFSRLSRGETRLLEARTMLLSFKVYRLYLYVEKDFMKGTITDAYANDALEVVCWRESFYHLLANGSPAEAVGAIGLGTENIVNKIYTPIIQAIKRLGTLERRDYVFFELHCEVDDDHHEALLRIAHDFAEIPGNRIDLRKGMLKALGFRARFWDWMHERARNRPPRS